MLLIINNSDNDLLLLVVIKSCYVYNKLIILNKSVFCSYSSNGNKQIILNTTNNIWFNSNFYSKIIVLIKLKLQFFNKK